MRRQHSAHTCSSSSSSNRAFTVDSTCSVDRLPSALGRKKEDAKHLAGPAAQIERGHSSLSSALVTDTLLLVSAAAAAVAAMQTWLVCCHTRSAARDQPAAAPTPPPPGFLCAHAPPPPTHTQGFVCATPPPPKPPLGFLCAPGGGRRALPPPPPLPPAPPPPLPPSPPQHTRARTRIVEGHVAARCRARGQVERIHGEHLCQVQAEVAASSAKGGSGGRCVPAAGVS
jgi:hypothetical protein